MNTAIFNLTHGLYVLTTRIGGRDNGCIVDAVMQASAMPQRVAVAVMKKNLSHGMLMGSGLFNLSILTEDTPQQVFQHFGLQSGATVDKFAGCTEEHRSQNGLLYIPKYTNAFLSCRVEQQHDLGSHTLFIAEVTESQVLGDGPSLTYADYRQRIKPTGAPASLPASDTVKKRWVCEVCGYVYEGDDLPADFICPWCKHPASDFKLVE